jgi:lactoylglutathione lyase
MKFGYVVLYVQDSEACLRFWTEQVGMVQRQRKDAAGHVIYQVGFADQDVSFELVPLALMQDNPDGLDLATPSVCFRSEELQTLQTKLVGNGVQATEVGEHFGMRTFAFCDPEGKWFAVAG